MFFILTQFSLFEFSSICFAGFLSISHDKRAMGTMTKIAAKIILLTILKISFPVKHGLFCSFLLHFLGFPAKKDTNYARDVDIKQTIILFAVEKNRIFQEICGPARVVMACFK